jgi:hypothetical protein
MADAIYRLEISQLVLIGHNLKAPSKKSALSGMVDQTIDGNV